MPDTTPADKREVAPPKEKRWRLAKVKKTLRILIVAGDDDGDAVARELIGELLRGRLRGRVKRVVVRLECVPPAGGQIALLTHLDTARSCGGGEGELLVSVHLRIVWAPTSPSTLTAPASRACGSQKSRSACKPARSGGVSRIFGTPQVRELDVRQ